MEILKRWNLECPKLKKTAKLTFSILETTTLDSTRREGVVDLLQKCSLCIDAGLGPCSDCQRAVEFSNLPVYLDY